MRYSILILISFGLLAAGCGGGDDEATPRASREAVPTNAKVDIRTFNFQPDPLTIKAGTEVTFVNHDAIGHTVTSGPRKSPDGRFDEKLAAAAGGKPTTAVVTFAEPGRYRYFCEIHPGGGMTAEVIAR